MNLNSRVRRIMSTTAALALTAAALIGASQPANAATTGTFDLQGPNGVTRVSGVVNFNTLSGQKANVTGIQGWDYSSDSKGPYLKINVTTINGVDTYIRSCASGANQPPCSMQGWAEYDRTVSKITVYACAGAGGVISSCGSSKTLYP